MAYTVPTAKLCTKNASLQELLIDFVNKADQSLLLQNNDIIQRLHYSEARGENQLILPNLISRAFFFLGKENSGGNISAEQINSVRHKKLWEQDRAVCSHNSECL